METQTQRSTTHTMRAMLVANIAVDQRFANGTQGRVLHWSPDAVAKTSKAVPAYSPEVLVRFCKESSTTKADMTSGEGVVLIQNTMSQQSMSGLGTQTPHSSSPAYSYISPIVPNVDRSIFCKLGHV